jgi:competence protein ComEA
MNRFGKWAAALVAVATMGVAPLARAQATHPMAQATQARPPRAAAPVAGSCNINTADEAQLVLLPGIGPARAKLIVAHRQKAPFKTVDEIVKVKGIGRKTFARLRPYLSVSGPNTLARARTQAVH